MSIEYVRAVYELKQQLGPTKRALLVALAEHANSQGLTWPGNTCLARETEISERQIQRLLPELETAGLLTTLRPGNGKGHPRLIRLLFPPAQIQRVTNEDAKGDMAPTKDDTLCHPLTDQKGDIRVTDEGPKGDISAPKGDMLPEVAAINPNYNPNNNPEPRGKDLDPVIAAPAVVEPAETAPTPPAQSQRPSKAKTPKLYPLTRPPAIVQSPHLRDPRKFKAGYIPPGAGSNPVEVWYESFSIHDDRWRLSAPQEDDLVRNCPDLDRLRLVLVAYRQHGQYAPRNLKLTFDWYRDGIPNRGGKAPERKQNEPDYDFSGYQPQLIVNGTAA